MWLVTQSCPTLCDPMDSRLLCRWDFPGKNIGVGCDFLLQGVFPMQGSNLCLLHCRQILYTLNHRRHHQVTSVMSYSVRLHRQQPTRLLCPWDLQARILGWDAISFSTREWFFKSLLFSTKSSYL